MRYKVKLKTVTLTLRESVAEQTEQLNKSDDVAELAKTIFSGLDADQEHILVFFLNMQNKVNGYKVVFSGGQSCVEVDIKVLFRNALLFGAGSIIVAHNHPSANCTPSEHDKEITEKIKQASNILQITFLDHVIISNTGNFSFAKAGIL